jgi:hypothetical protein
VTFEDDDEDVPRDISLQKSVKLILLCLFSKKTHQKSLSPSFAVCSVCPKKKIQTLLSSLSLAKNIPLLVLAFSLSVRKVSLFRRVAAYSKLLVLVVSVFQNHQRSHTLTLSNSNSVTLSLSEEEE